MTTPLAVDARDLHVLRDGRTALCEATFSIPTGTRTAVIGPNGSGKSTLLRALSGLEPIHRGALRVLGRPPGSDAKAIAHVLQSTPDTRALPLTAHDVVRMGRYPHHGLIGRLNADDHTAIRDAMQRLEVTDLAHRQLSELSGGQRQRVLVAQGLAQQAPLLLLDEPGTGLDATSEERIEQAITDELAAGNTVITTTHDVHEASLADYVILVATHLVAAGPPAEVLTEEHLAHAYGGRAYRTDDGLVVIGDPHRHGAQITPHLDDHDHHH